MAYGFGKASFADGLTDAFGRLRVSEPVTQFEAKFTYGNEEKLFNTTTATGGAATFLSNEAAWNLTTTTASGSRVLRQSWRYFHYHTGKGQEIILTGVFDAPVANCTKRLGYYDDNDGLFFTQNGTLGFGVCRRTSTSGSPVDNLVYQSSWNIDKMDGTGKSGITLDPTKTNIFFIDFQWLGVGSVRFGVDIDGILYYVHQMNHANVELTQVYMKSAWLPVRYEIVNTAATASVSSLKQICATVMSEGGIEEIGVAYSIGELNTSNATTGNWIPVTSIRVGTTLNAQPFRGLVKLTGMSGLNTSANYAMVAVFENPTLTGANWVAVGGSSVCEYDFGASAVTGGIQRATFFSARTVSTDVGADANLVAPAGTVYTLAARGIGGTATICGAINWREIV